MISDLQLQIKSIISQVLGVNLDAIDDTFAPDRVTNWDSMHHMKIIISIEEKYKVVFKADEITELVSFKKLYEAVLAKL